MQERQQFCVLNIDIIVEMVLAPQRSHFIPMSP